jgi:hypothetical protein
MNRKFVAGLGLAGVLTLLSSLGAFAEKADIDLADPGEALMMQAQVQADTVSDGIKTCAMTKSLSLRTMTAPAGVTADQWAQAIDQATGQVKTIADQANGKVETAVESFDSLVEAAAENGTQLPALTPLTLPLPSLTDTCAAINAVVVNVTPGTVTPPKTESDDTQGDDTEKADVSDKTDVAKHQAAKQTTGSGKHDD